MEKKEIGVKLSEPLEFSKKGEQSKTAELVFRCPSMDTFNESSDLSQLVMAAILDAGKHVPQGDTPKQKDSEMDAEAVKMILMSARSVRFTEVADAFKALAQKCGTYDGEEVFGNNVFGKISIDDFQKCICEYIANFTVPSLLSGQKGDSGQKKSGTKQLQM